MIAWDPSHEDPDEKTRRLRREIQDDFAIVFYVIIAAFVGLFAAMKWVRAKLTLDWRDDDEA